MRKYATNAVTIGFLLLALAVAAWAALQYNDLKRDVTQQRARLAEIQSAALYVEGVTYGVSDLYNRLESLCTQSRQSDEIAAFCRVHLPSINALRFLMVASQARVAAVRTGNYDAVRQSYGRLVDFLSGSPDDDWRRGWMALAKEGIAYADLKLGRLSEARAVIEEAARLNPNDASVGATALKIRCVQRNAAGQVATAFAALTRQLDEHVASTDPAGEEGRNARLERDFLARDAELYQFCAYAGLAPADLARPAG